MVFKRVCFSVTPCTSRHQCSINDDEPGLHLDYENWLERLIHEPVASYRHNVGRQRRRSHETPDHGKSGGGRHKGQPGFRYVGAACFCGEFRRQAEEAGSGQNNRGNSKLRNAATGLCPTGLTSLNVVQRPDGFYQKPERFEILLKVSPC